MFAFYIENHEPLAGVIDKELPIAGQECIMSTFSIFVVYKSAFSTIQKSNYLGCFNLRQ